MSLARPGARKDAFEEVVAEDGVFGRTRAHGRLDRIDVVDPLADEGPLGEHVLIKVRDRRSVGIHPGRAGEDLLEPGAARLHRQRHRHAGLDDSVSIDDAPCGLVEIRPVERMGHPPGKLCDRVPRHAGVGVERHDVTDARRKNRRVAADGHERCAGLTAKEAIELLELAAFPFPTHPGALRPVPLTPPMHQVEARPRRDGDGGD